MIVTFQLTSTINRFCVLTNSSLFIGCYWKFMTGLAAIGMNYRVDYEKQLFRETGGKCNLW